MADNVTSIHGGPVQAPQCEPIPDIVAELELLLELAKSGQLRAVAFASVLRGGTNRTGWNNAGGTAWSLGAAIMTLHARFGNHLASNE